MLTKYQSFNLKRARLNTAFFACIALFAFARSTFADGILSQGPEEIRTYRLNEPTLTRSLGCTNTEVGCNNTALRLLTEVSFARLQVTGGAAAIPGSESGTFFNPMTRIHIETVSENLPMGDAHLGKFDVVYLPNNGGLRLNLAIGEVEAAFFCTDEARHIHAPLLGRPAHYCTPDARFGLGASLAALQWDIGTGRFVGQWAQFNAVLNFFGNGHGVAYVRRHLNAFLGTSVETAWHGNIPHAASEPQTNLRAIMGLSGLVRSNDARWEFNGDFIFRPAIIGTAGSFSDLALQSRVLLAHHFFMNENTLGTVGITSEVTYCQIPGNCRGIFASDREPITVFVGAIFGVTFEYSQY